MQAFIRKITSRKFLAALAGIATGLAMVFGVDENTISTVAGAPTVVVVERICALRGEPIEKAKRKKPGNTSEKERPQKKRFRRRRRKKGASPGTPQENS